MKAHYKHEHSELESYKVTAYPKDPNPNAISASLALSLSLSSCIQLWIADYSLRSYYK